MSYQDIGDLKSVLFTVPITRKNLPAMSNTQQLQQDIINRDKEKTPKPKAAADRDVDIVKLRGMSICIAMTYYQTHQFLMANCQPSQIKVN